MDFSKEKNGNLTVSFKSQISVDNGYMNRYLGIYSSTMELILDGGATVFNGRGTIEWESDISTEYIGVFWENGCLMEYDGVFEMPHQACKLLEHYGVVVPQDFYD